MGSETAHKRTPGVVQDDVKHLTYLFIYSFIYLFAGEQGAPPDSSENG